MEIKMKNIYDNLLKKINDKKVELSERQDSFEIMWNNKNTLVVLKEMQLMIY